MASSDFSALVTKNFWLTLVRGISYKKIDTIDMYCVPRGDRRESHTKYSKCKVLTLHNLHRCRPKFERLPVVVASATNLTAEFCDPELLEEDTVIQGKARWRSCLPDTRVRVVLSVLSEGIVLSLDWGPVLLIGGMGAATASTGGGCMTDSVQHLPSAACSTDCSPHIVDILLRQEGTHTLENQMF